MSVIPSSRIRSVAALAAVAAVALVPGTASANRDGHSVAKRDASLPINGHRVAEHGHALAKNGHSARLRDAGDSAVSSLAASGACDSTNHTNSFGASVMLNGQRFPNGAWVVVRYGYRRPGASTGPRTRWYGPTKISNYIGTTAPDVWGAGVPMYGPTQLRDVSFNVYSGRILGWVGVGVWNGSAYEYTYAWGDHYINSTPWGSITAASCWLS
jgi:hypothetical protein